MIVCHILAHFSVWLVIIRIDHITQNGKTIAGKENIEVKDK